jgi:MYXO-CTERM domain-containing protein
MPNAIVGGNINQGQTDLIPGSAVGVAQQPGTLSAGQVAGVQMKDIRLNYNASTDTLYVGINPLPGAVIGNYTGTANDPDPHFGGMKALAIALSPVNAQHNGAATPVAVAGIPEFKSSSPTTTLDGFNVATFNPNAPSGTIASAFGTTLTNNLGNLAYDPSTAHPGFEFTIKNFSKIPGLNALQNGGFYLQAFSGNGQLIVDGKDAVGNTFVSFAQPQNLLPPPSGTVTPPPPPPIKPNNTPEPTTVLAWGLVAGGAAWRLRRRLRETARP